MSALRELMGNEKRLFAVLNDHPNSISEIKEGEGEGRQWSFITGDLMFFVIPG